MQRDGHLKKRAQAQMSSPSSSPHSQHWEVTESEPQIQDFHWPLYTPRLHSSSEEQEDLEPDESLPFLDSQTTSSVSELRQDYRNIALLLFLYLLQGIPLGLTASIPLVLSSRHVSYTQQAVFSFAYWPFSLKLLWAPVVDSCYWNWLGRRKSWLIPTQYLIGIFMLILSNYVTSILGDAASTEQPNVLFLTVIFFAFNFLAATQDIAVDGWALTMLSRKNVGHASTCNAVGQTAGFFLGNVVFLALESADFCNGYLRSIPQPQGLVTLADFVYGWAWVYLVTTTMVLLLKREVDRSSANGDVFDELRVSGTYRLLWRIVCMKPVLTLVVILLTAKIGFAAADGITGLKLVELGVPKDKMALLAIPLVPLQILLPWFISKYTAGPRPLTVLLKAYPFRLFIGLGFLVVVHWTPAWQLADSSFPVSYYIMIVLVYCVHQVTVYSIFVAQMAFYAQISDPVVGGTYMTLLNTITNLGGNWPVTLALSIVDDFTWKVCATESKHIFGPCQSESECASMGGKCEISIDGYYILSFFCFFVGFVWWRMMKRKVERLQNLDRKEWSCVTRN